MAKSNGSTKCIACIIITIIFAIIGGACIVIGYYNDIVSWLSEFGIAFLVMSIPMALWIIYNIVANRVKDM